MFDSGRFKPGFLLFLAVFVYFSWNFPLLSAEEIKVDKNTDIPVKHDLSAIHKWLPQTKLHLLRLGCKTCHAASRPDLKRYVEDIKASHLTCSMCHSEIAKEYEKSCHYQKLNFACQVCHNERTISAEKPGKKNFKKAVLKNCTECHATAEYVNSGHGKAVLAGNQDAPVCSDCHGLHNTRAFETCLKKNPAEAKEFYNMACKKCHADEKMMKRNNLSPETVSYYENTYHGRVQSITYPSKVAGCVDCHTSHNILPKESIFSTINPANLIKNCGKCHEGFHPQFVQYRAHPDYHDSEKYPVLYWAFVSMSGLLVLVFLFFGAHTVLWWRKVYWEKYRLEKEGVILKSPLSDKEKLQEVQRFSVLKRIMHVVLILCFFTLVLTGFPLRFYYTKWAEFLISLWGGADLAGHFHRVAALIMIGLFFVVLWMCIRFLFFGEKGLRGWTERLFGPESLMFNKKDWEDLKGMHKWFFGRGEMPKFERWNYWEKFDFFAVFWGMTVIGSSGLILMNPEWSSYIFPGWIFNVALLIHSDEGLLAALFIFVVHYFNTHLIPNKFPMDRIVFSGRYKLEELRQQRPLEYERLVSEKRLETLKAEHPSIFTMLLSAVFGYVGLMLGIFCAIMIIISLMTHYF